MERIPWVVVLRAGLHALRLGMIRCRSQRRSGGPPAEVDELTEALGEVSEILAEGPYDGFRSVRARLGRYDAERWGGPDLVAEFDRRAFAGQDGVEKDVPQGGGAAPTPAPPPPEAEVGRPGQVTLTSFETALMERLVAQFPHLGPHCDELHVLARTFTGVGSFTEFECGREPQDSGPLVLEDFIVMPGLENGMGAVLWCVGDRPKELETFAYGERWNGDFTGFVLEDVSPGNR